MFILAVTWLNGGCRRWARPLLPAFLMLIGALSHAKADPRIDKETAARVEAPAAAKASAQPTASQAASGPVDTVVEQQGFASWYGKHWRGRRTASGARFNDRLLTAASLSLPLKTLAHVTNLQNGRSVDVLVNDRGPYVTGRIMDLSAAAAAALGMTHSGLALVAIRVQLAAQPAG